MKPELENFIQQMVEQHNFTAVNLQQLFTNIQPLPDVIKHMTHPAESMAWVDYRKRLLTQKRIEQGVSFWQQNNAILETAEQQFKVPAGLIVAILGIESFYGQKNGTYPVLQTLYTLAFDYPPRSNFFKKELESFLLLTREHKLDPLSLKGSYAGAMGAPQFISSSYRNFAASFQQNQPIDLINKIEDSIASIANYLKVHGWQLNNPIAIPAKIDKKRYTTTIKSADKKNPLPVLSLQQLDAQGIKPVNMDKINLPNKAALLSLESKTDAELEYWLGFHNFYVITRYNHSTWYAMVVYQLSQAIEQAKNLK